MHIWKRGIAVTLAAVGLAIFTPGTARVAAEDLWFEGTVQKSGPTGVTVKVEGFRMGNLYRKPPPSVEILSSEIPAHLLPLIRPGDRIEFKRIKRVVQEKGVEILESLLLLDGSEANRLVLFYGEPLDFPLTDYLLAGAAGKKESRIRMIRFDPIGRTPDGLYSENRLFLTLKRDGKDRRLILDPGTYLEEEGLTVGFYFAYSLLPKGLGSGARNRARLLITSRAGELPDLKRVEIDEKGEARDESDKP